MDGMETCGGDSSDRKFVYPDPGGAVWPFPASLDPSVGRRWLRQKQMRGQILAAARREMAEAGYEGVQLRAIAADCGISVQTIYNLVGDRTQVMRQCSEEWVTALETAAQQRVAGTEISPLLALLGAFWASPLHHGEYVSSAARIARARDHPLNRAFRCAAIKSVHAILADLRAQDLLRGNIDAMCLARSLTSTIQIAIYDWTVDRYDEAIYWREFENGPLLSLLSAVQPAETRRIERGFESIAAQPCFSSHTHH